MYPGRPLADSVTPAGVTHGSTAAFAAGVVTRGVLLDLAVDGPLPGGPVTGRLLGRYVLAPLAPFIRYWSNPKTTAQVITRVLTGNSRRTGVSYDEKGRLMNGSTLVRDPEFSGRVVAETRALLARVPA